MTIKPELYGNSEDGTLTKRCSKCLEYLPTTCFYNDSRRPSKFQPWCKTCKQKLQVQSGSKQKKAQWREKNRSNIRVKDKEYQEENASLILAKKRLFKTQLNEYKKNHNCYFCEVSGNDAKLHFHHRDPRDRNFLLSQMHGYTDVKLQKEMDKCLLLCPKCHIKLHAEMRRWGKCYGVDVKSVKLKRGQNDY